MKSLLSYKRLIIASFLAIMASMGPVGACDQKPVPQDPDVPTKISHSAVVEKTIRLIDDLTIDSGMPFPMHGKYDEEVKQVKAGLASDNERLNKELTQAREEIERLKAQLTASQTNKT
jgi:hypothetical protein